MKSGFLLMVIFLAGCQQRHPVKKLKLAAAHVEQSAHNAAAARRDSIEIEEQNQHSEWMVKTFYALKQMGYNYKKTWQYIDSATRAIYMDTIPHWYLPLKKQTDSSIRDKKLYRRVPIY